MFNEIDTCQFLYVYGGHIESVFDSKKQKQNRSLHSQQVHFVNIYFDDYYNYVIEK